MSNSFPSSPCDSHRLLSPDSWLSWLLMCAVIASRSCFPESGSYVQAQKMFSPECFLFCRAVQPHQPKTRFGIFFFLFDLWWNSSCDSSSIKLRDSWSRRWCRMHGIFNPILSFLVWRQWFKHIFTYTALRLLRIDFKMSNSLEA